MKTLKEISHDCYYKMERYHQVSIDFIEDAEDFFDTKPTDLEGQLELITNLNVLSYNIGICLEVFNPEFEIEISDLIDLTSLIEIRVAFINSLEF